ncbi:MAG: uncharacterized SAM-binding protein YcdF (DUF218 family) [Parasphingorhabdus sp.]|jgi:uncharacterized SAM-binding protein YcdF (DUF218 family)
MWISLSKTLPYLLFPLSLTLELLLLGLVVRYFGGKRSGTILMLLGLVVLFIFSSPLVSTRLVQSLESHYTGVKAEEMPVVDAIVILGGAVSLPLSPRPTEELHGASDRVLYGSRLYHSGRAPVIIITGGNVFRQNEPVQSESFYIAKLLVEWGVPEEAIIIEGASKNTRQNALKTKKLLEEKGYKTILLVTSAFHMPRSFATFHRVGITTIPAPTDFRVANYNQPFLLNILPSSDALAGSTFALREYLGILVYGLRGWLDAKATLQY